MLIFAGQLRPDRFIMKTLYSQRRRALLLSVLLVLCCVPADVVAQQSSERDTSRLILAHYMPWYVAKPASGIWGWHWTMDTFDPETRVDGKRAVASHFYPLIGPYDSGDPAVLEYHLLTMKLAGIDGVIVDWYGLQQFRDYAIPVAFPRFVDIYAEAKVSASYGRVADNRGATFKTSMTESLQAKTPLLQIAIWNDWGEGTMIEPSREFGYRDLEVLQQLRRRYLDAQFSATPADLRLPARLLQRRRMSTTAAQSERSARIAKFIATGKLAEARAGLKETRRH